MSQIRTHQLEGRKREEQVGELGNMAHHTQGLTCWRGERGRSRLVSLETWHITNEDSPTRGEEGGGAGVGELGNMARHTRTHFLEGRKKEWIGELGSVARHKRGLTPWRGRRGRSGLVSLETWHVTNEDSPSGGEEEGAGW